MAAIQALCVFLALQADFFAEARSSSMSKRTVLNENYKGLVENMSIPAEVHERDGKKFASSGTVVPIHCCTPEQIRKLSKTTHHYCDVFTDVVLAPLGDIVYVRLDENMAEKVFVNRTKRILLISSDGTLAQWRSAPTFESANLYMAGTPIVNKDGELVSVVTAKRGNHYAVSSFDGDGGYFSTSKSWVVLDAVEGTSVYGDKAFSTREELRQYLKTLPRPARSANDSPTPIVHRGVSSRIALLANTGNQISYQYLHGVIATDVEYL